MRAGLSSIQQTLTPEAATVLNQSIAEARRRNHGQTTPLHVAATLLASPSGYLRQACIRSHPNSSHPLQCRALELCFSVALERLTAAQNAPEMEPPISNALMAALKRAQAHQRRGCPEQQQQPLLAVKVELDQLIISILDDPSVSRVMREASFSSPAVKASIEHTLNKNSSNNPIHYDHHHMSFGAIGQFTPNPVQLAPNPARSTHTSVQLAANPGQLTPPSPLGNRNLYLNPRLQQHGAITGRRGEEVKKVLEIMGQVKKKNPVLVGDYEPDVVVKEVLRKIQSKDLEIDEVLKNVEIVSMDKGVLSDKSQILAKIKELGYLVESKIGSGVGVILDLGDLKWLVEQPVGFGGLQPQPQQQVISEIGKAAVVEMAGLLARFGGDGANEENSRTNGSKLWLIGTATCETYLRCQVYHSKMENDWDLQAVPIASRLPLPGMFPRMLSNPTPLKTVPTPMPTLTRPVSENSDIGQQSTFCPKCSQNYEKDLAKLSAIENTFFTTKQDANKPSLPQWLQTAKLKTSDQSQGKDGVFSKQKTQELHKKWKDTCLNLHPNFHQNSRSTRPGPPALSMPSLYNPNLLSGPPFQPRLLTTSKPLGVGGALQLNMNPLTISPNSQTIKPLGEALQLNMNPVTSSPNSQTTKPLGEALQFNMNPLTGPIEQVSTPPGSPVRTELALGTKGTPEKPAEVQAKDFLSCISSEPNTKLLEKFANALDADTYKKLLKGLMEKAWWQAEAASSVASAITRCSLGNGKHGGRGDVWLLFSGPDRTGKRKMASVLADQICGSHPIMIRLGMRRDDEEMDISFRGKTAIDRIAEAVRRNPFSVIMLEDIDEADALVRGSIKRAIERGRLTDTHGREVGLGNAVFILTGDWLRDGHSVDEKKLASAASGNWRLGLIVRENSKRRAHWVLDGDRSLKARKEMGSGLSLDLNLAVDNKRSHNEHRDLTADHEEELGLVNRQFAITSVPHDLVNNVDDSIVFKPVDSAFVRREIKKTIAVKFAMVVDEKLEIEVDDDVLEKIMGGLWHDRSSLEEWVENVVEPSFEQLKRLLPYGDRGSSVVRVVVESDGVTRGNGDCWLPSTVLV